MLSTGNSQHPLAENFLELSFETSIYSTRARRGHSARLTLDVTRDALDVVPAVLLVGLDELVEVALRPVDETLQKSQDELSTASLPTMSAHKTW